MVEPFENLYFNWLCAKVSYTENPAPSNVYDNLLRVLHNTEFVWIVSGDMNRAEDGRELREEFQASSHYPAVDIWLEFPCSILEMLIAFSRRAEYMTDIPAKEWFWEILDNLRLAEYTNAAMHYGADPTPILYDFVWRQYSPSGEGGMFPLHEPKEDQREVEIWYQFAEYLEDQNRMP